MPIRPLVDQPQIQNVPNRIQNVRDRALSLKVRMATVAGPTSVLTGGGGSQSSGAPYGVVPMSVGR